MSKVTLQPYVSATPANTHQSRPAGWVREREMFPLRWRAMLFAALFFTAVPISWAQFSVVTQHNNNARTGANLSETVLTTTNVNVSQFGKLFERAVDDQIYGQPLYVPNVNIPNVGTRNIVLVATVNDSVYAFDAENPAATSPLWSVSYVNPAAGILAETPADNPGCKVFQSNVGIVGTPVIDQTGQTMYFVVRTKESGTFVQRLHAISIANGSERPNSPMLIQATVPGTGDDYNPQTNTVSFNAKAENQRAALLLANGIVYIAWASYCDVSPYHGWILGYEAATLQRVVVYNTAANGGLAGIWQSGQGLAADASGNIYAVTGNGTFDANVGGSSLGDSFIKLSPAGALLDWFAPFNQATLDSKDQDLGIQGPLLIPDTNFVAAGGKAGVFYVVNANNMGHFQSVSDSQIVQSFQLDARTFGAPVYWNSPNYGPLIYLWGPGTSLQAFQLVGGLFHTSPVAQSSVLAPTGMPGAMLSLSANAGASGTGILWAGISSGGNPEFQVTPGMVRAYDASDVTKELWNSEQNSTRDRLGNFSKFSPPTIANGRVYVATLSNKLVVYGLLAGQVAVPSVVSMTQANAAASLAAVGLIVGTVTSASSTTVAAGSVIGQTPIAGALVQGGSAVNLVVSSGPPLPPPGAPFSTSATAVSSTQINLAWTNTATNATGIRILRCPGSCAPSTVIATLASTATTYQNTGLASSTAYSYIVEAYNSGGVGDSSRISQTTLAAPQPPAAPVLTVGSSTTSSLTLNWTESSTNVSSFNIYRCSTTNCTPNTLIATVAGAVFSYKNTGLSRVTTYRYRIKANNGGGSKLSNIVSGRTN